MNENIPLFAAAAGILGLLIAFVLYRKVNEVKIDNKTVGDITQEIQDGAMAFLYAEYRVLSVFVVIVGILLFFLNDLYIGLIIASLSSSVKTAVLRHKLKKNVR